MKHAVNILVVREDLVLTVSRRNDPTKWGLPGGKVDGGEEHLQACIRETLEETGVVVYKRELQPLMSARSVGAVDYWATTYLYTGPLIIDSVLEAESGLYIAWKPWWVLVDAKQSPFWAYNMRLRDAYLDYTNTGAHLRG